MFGTYFTYKSYLSEPAITTPLQAFWVEHLKCASDRLISFTSPVAIINVLALAQTHQINSPGYFICRFSYPYVRSTSAAMFNQYDVDYSHIWQFRQCLISGVKKKHGFWIPNFNVWITKCNLCLAPIIASTGQTFIQIVQPMHSLVSIVAIGKFLISLSLIFLDEPFIISDNWLYVSFDPGSHLSSASFWFIIASA